MPITGKEMVKLALANGWIEVRKRGSHHHFKKEGSPILSLFQFTLMRI